LKKQLEPLRIKTPAFSTVNIIKFIKTLSAQVSENRKGFHKE